LAYKNVDGPFPAAKYQKLLFGEPGAAPCPPQRTMTQYYMDISHDKLQVTGQVLGWYKLPQDDTYYEGSENGTGRPFGELLTFGLKMADAEVDFGLFDNDGPDGIPNSGDDDADTFAQDGCPDSTRSHSASDDSGALRHHDFGPGANALWQHAERMG
jgi:M6 family metalloprotease-like protein